MFLPIATLFFVIFLPVIHVAKMLTGVPAQQQSDVEGFWIAANLLNVEWKSSCLTVIFCDKPELKMVKTNSINGERNSYSWELDHNLELLSNNAFISHWTTGSPVDIEMSIIINGIDPKYRFQRSCDQSATTKAFKYEGQESYSAISDVGNASDFDRMIVELRGRCFNATLTVQKFVGCCPWCIKIKTSTSATTIKSYENEFTLINRYGLVVLTCIVTSCLVIMCAVPCISSLREESGKLAERKTAILPAKIGGIAKQQKLSKIGGAENNARSKSWKIVKIENDDLTSDTTSEIESSSGRSNSKSDSLIDRVGDQILVHSDTVIESDRSSTINSRTYDSITYPDL